MPWMLAVLAGLVAGSAHVVTGPDHLAAVLPLAVDDRRRAGRVGASWGLGHGAGVLALGAVGQLAKGWVDVEVIASWSELIVGVLLIGIGAWALWRARVIVVHAHGHVHGHAHHHPHAHPHVHIGDPTVGSAVHVRLGRHRAHRHSAFGFGLLHGTAGAGHLFGVLPSLALPPGLAAVYLGTYVLAAVGSMTAVAWGAGMLAARVGRLPVLLRATGVLAIAIGVVWIGSGLVA